MKKSEKINFLERLLMATTEILVQIASKNEGVYKEPKDAQEVIKVLVHYVASTMSAFTDGEYEKAEELADRTFEEVAEDFKAASGCISSTEEKEVSIGELVVDLLDTLEEALNEARKRGVK